MASKIPSKLTNYNILGSYNKLHYPGHEEQDSPILPEKDIVSEEDIPQRIESEIMFTIISILLGDNIHRVVDALNMLFNKNVHAFELITCENEYQEMKQKIKNNPKYKDGIVYAKGYTSDSVHFYYENESGIYDGYTQMKQLDGGHQYCQGHAIAFAYFPEYRDTYESVKDKTWFKKGHLTDAYKEAYIKLMDMFELILPVVLQSITKKDFLIILNQVLKDQHLDTFDGGEDPRYYKFIKNHMCELLI